MVFVSDGLPSAILNITNERVRVVRADTLLMMFAVETSGLRVDQGFVCMTDLLCKEARDFNEAGQRYYRIPFYALCICTIIIEEVDNGIVLMKSTQTGALARYCALT